MVRDRATFRREDDFDGDRLIAGTERDSIIGQIRFSFRGFFLFLSSKENFVLLPPTMLSRSRIDYWAHGEQDVIHG